MRVGFVLLGCLAVASCSAVATLDEQNDMLQTDDCTIMMDAFIRGQRGLIAEFKVATLAVANVVLPGFDFDLTINTSIAHPNTNATCPNPPPEFPLFIINQFQTWIQLLHNLVAGITYTGAQIGTSITNDEMIATFMSSRKQLANYPDVNGGSGFGMGFQILCGETQIFSFGGGGGGGAGQNSSGFGGGGGAGMETPVDIQVGGGGGCSCGTSMDSCFSCGNQQQQDDNGNLLTMTPIVVQGVDQCASDNITVCFSGGAGGGLSAPNEDCFYGAGFGVGMAVTISGGGIVNGKYVGGKLSQGDPNLCNGVPGNNNNNNSGQNAINTVVTNCNAACQSAANFNDCYCPCFKNGLIALGLTWAETMTCYIS